jgi:large subunit ribosomal protein L4
MIELMVYNQKGEQVDTVEVDEARLGGHVRPKLLKQALVMYHANRRVGTASTRSRGMVAGSTRKIYRQKGTGHARMGAVRSPVRRGGGMAFAKSPRDFSQTMPRKMRRLARNSAILAKMQSNETVIVDDLTFEQPKTKAFAGVLESLKIRTGCLVALAKSDDVVWKSGRNLPKTEIRPVAQLNAYEVLRRKHLLMTRAALDLLLGESETPPAGA